jgi:hypothetical protein
MSLDSTYVATAVAALQSSLGSVAASMLGREIQGFDSVSFETYLDAERHLLASSGVLVVTLDASRLVLLDPLTTEAGGAGVTAFAEPNASPQKDNLRRRIIGAVRSQLRGVVPDDLAEVILDIKTVVGNTIEQEILAGEVGKYRDANGRARPIDLSRDVQAMQHPTDPTKYKFRYSANMRYVAKRFDGEFTVDAPLA